MRARRRLLAALVSLFAAAGLLALPTLGDEPVDRAAAADNGLFVAGNIITDQLFFNGGAMTAGEVQQFLNVRNPRCVAGSDGSPCLKNYRQNTWTRAGDTMCPRTYAGAANETAATIITKVGQACGISQRVLLVILQKEQGLVTATGGGLYADRYRKAMGYACPDTAPCDAAYYGFFNQVYSAAYRYKYYAANPGRYNHRAGQVNHIRFHPNPDCGTSPVYIANQATAGLYNYTPYQPSRSALNAGAGEGDGCAAYGNRNFWRYFTDWFGSTQTAGAGDLVDLYVSTGGENGPLGPVTTPVNCGLKDGGCSQGYANASIYWSPSTGARAMLGPIRDLWLSTGGERGGLGYPTTSVSIAGDGVGHYAHFQGGTIIWSAETGARAVLGPIRDLWAAGGWERGALGYPLTSVSLAGDGVGHYAHFQGGTVLWSASTGARTLLGPIRDLYASTGWERGGLGYPTTSVSTTRDGTGQYAHFQSGSIFWTAGTGARAVLGPVRDLWTSTGAEAGLLGYPTTSVSTTADGRGNYGRFQGGSIYWTPETGVRAVLGPIGEMWLADGAETSSLGYPVTSVSTAPDGQGHYAHFQGGSATWTSADGVRRLAAGPVHSLWRSTGMWALGYPTSGVTPTADGAGEFATFTNGSIYSTPETGTRAMLGPVGALWASTGAEAGVLGYPTTSVSTTPDGKGHYAHFEGGSILWTPQTGARAVMGPIRDLWASTGGERGGLGYPTSSVSTAADGTGQYATFQGGAIYWTADTGARAVLGPVQALWNATGAEQGGLGYPTTSVSTTRDGKGHYAHFEGGSIYWTPQTGARAMLGPVGALWTSTGAERGVLGYPTTSVSTAADGVGNFAHFQGGSIYWSPSTGAHVVRGALRDAWAATGWERGRLGYPTSAAYPVNGGTRMDFSKGILTISTRTGQVFVEVTG